MRFPFWDVSMGYGILMAVADRVCRSERSIVDVRLRDALVIGFAQALSLMTLSSLLALPVIALIMRETARAALD